MKRFGKLGGLYLVVSPILPVEQLLSATDSALDGGVDIFQLSVEKETEATDALASVLVGVSEKTLYTLSCKQ